MESKQNDSGRVQTTPYEYKRLTIANVSTKRGTHPVLMSFMSVEPTIFVDVDFDKGITFGTSRMADSNFLIII